MNGKTNLENKIIEFWSVSQAAAGCSRYDRMQYVKKMLLEKHPELTAGYSNKELWFAIQDQLN